MSVLVQQEEDGLVSLIITRIGNLLCPPRTTRVFEHQVEPVSVQQQEEGLLTRIGNLLIPPRVVERQVVENQTITVPRVPLLNTVTYDEPRSILYDFYKLFLKII